MRTEGQAETAAVPSCALRHRQNRLHSAACETLILPMSGREPGTFPNASPCSSSRALSTDSMLCTLGRALPAYIINRPIIAVLILHGSSHPRDLFAWG